MSSNKTIDELVRHVRSTFPDEAPQLRQMLDTLRPDAQRGHGNRYFTALFVYVVISAIALEREDAALHDERMRRNVANGLHAVVAELQANLSIDTGRAVKAARERMRTENVPLSDWLDAVMSIEPPAST